MARRFVPLVLTLACACAGADRFRNARAPDAARITVLVPGYRGSFLYAGDRIAYITPPQAFSAGDHPLGTCEEGREPLDPGGPLSRFIIFPYQFDVYAGFIEWAELHLDAFTAFGYDWRDDLLVTADRLCSFIGDRKADVIAHSMGGLVTMLALQRCGDRIGSTAFAGTPFRGAPGVLKDLFRGSATWRNTTLLSPQALWTFSATWQLMPRTDDFFVDSGGNPTSLPISNADTWAGWPQACPGRLAERLADRARMPVDFQRVPQRALAIIGRGRTVTLRIRIGEAGLDLDHPVLTDGDGSVAAANAAPPFPAKWVYTDTEHTALLNDASVRATIEEFFR